MTEGRVDEQSDPIAENNSSDSPAEFLAGCLQATDFGCSGCAGCATLAGACILALFVAFSHVV